MSDLEIKNRISQKAREHFFKFGFSTVTMNEIATELGMSKKTLYAYFPSKEELLMASIRQMQDETNTKIEQLIADENMDFGDKLNNILGVVVAHHSKFDTRFLTDLQRNVPDVYRCCDEFRRDRMRANTTAVIRQGIEKGVFRNDINEEFLTELYIVAVRNMMTPEVLEHLPFTAPQAFEMLMRVLFGGIFSDEGRKQYLPKYHQERGAMLEQSAS